MTDHTTPRTRPDRDTSEARPHRTDRPSGPHVTLDAGDARQDVDLASLSTVERECAVVCASGERTTGTWAGVEVTRLLDVTDPLPSTTHLRIGSDDGYRACVDLTDALSALVAVARDGRRLGAVEAYDTRFVGARIDGERSVKGVSAVEALSLSPDEDPTEYETLSLDDPRYG
jgi:hypothetical protein